MKYILLHDIVEANGKTIRENNLARQHGIPVGALVEVREDSDDPTPLHGVRLYVVEHSRDCDGTPLYSLGVPKELGTGEIDRFDRLHWHTGFPEHWLVVITPKGGARDG